MNNPEKRKVYWFRRLWQFNGPYIEKTKRIAVPSQVYWHCRKFGGGWVPMIPEFKPAGGTER